MWQEIIKSHHFHLSYSILLGNFVADLKPTTERINTQILCAYCGKPCTKDKVEKGDQCYCCFGCATLDSVVNQLYGDKDIPIHFRQYDLPEVFQKAIEFENDSFYRIRLQTPSIHCSSCVELIEDLPELDQRVMSSQVNFEEKSVLITAQKDLPLSQLAYLLDRLGYPPHFDLGETSKRNTNTEQRNMLKKLAVTGFCFGNTMLFSLPHYLGLELANDAFFVNLFRVLNLGLSIVVVVYGAREYLISAFKAISLRKSHINIPIAIGILALWFWSLYELVSGIGFGYFDSLAGLIFFLLAGKWFQSRVYKKISFERSLHDLLPLTVRLSGINADLKRVSDLQVGDKIIVKNDEVIPVSGALSKGEALIDYSFVTGESIAQSVELNDVIYIGGKQLLGDIEIMLTSKPDPETIWSAWKTSKKEDSDRHWTARVSKYFTPAVLIVAFGSALFWYFYQPEKALFVFSSVLIVACPCALALSSPFTFGSIHRFFSRNGLYMKSTDYIGRIADIDHIVFDKTGTLTDSNQAQITVVQNDLSPREERAVKSLAIQSNHVVSKWLATKLNGELVEVNDFNVRLGLGVSAVVDGMEIRIGSSSFFDVDAPPSGTHAIVEIDGSIKAIFLFGNTYKNGLQEMLQDLGAKYNLSVLSGDNDSERGNLEKMYSEFSHLGFKQLPEDKRSYMETLRAEHHSSLMIGDGLNDQIALTSSDIGLVVAQNINGFYPNSDGVLMSEQMSKLPLLMRLGSYATSVLWLSLTFSILYNLIGLSFAVTGQLNPMIAAVLMPISSITVVGLVTALVSRKAKKLKLA